MYLKKNDQKLTNLGWACIPLLFPNFTVASQHINNSRHIYKRLSPFTVRIRGLIFCIQE